MTQSQLFRRLQPGMVLGNRYELLRFLGRGGFGSVFLARDRMAALERERKLKQR